MTDLLQPHIKKHSDLWGDFKNSKTQKLKFFLYTSLTLIKEVGRRNSYHAILTCILSYITHLLDML
jgi:hypothetical protein